MVRQENINYFDGDIQNSICRGHINLERFIEANRNPAPRIADLLKRINQASADGDKKLKKDLKGTLPYFIPGVVIPKHRRRRYANIESFTGYMQLDIDGIQNADQLKDFMWTELRQLICCYLSPSGQGVKALLKIPIVETIDEYKEYFLGIEHWFEEMSIDGFDHAPFNAILPLYISHDPNILYRTDALTWHTRREMLDPEQTKNLNPTPRGFDAGGDAYDFRSPMYYERITLEIFDKKMLAIDGAPGHTRMRSACLVLGTRVGADYIGKVEAESRAIEMIEANSYLAKDVAGYTKTALWAIRMGSLTPKYYN